MLLEMAIGDAYAAPFAGYGPEAVADRLNNGVQEIERHTYSGRIQPVMAVMETLLKTPLHVPITSIKDDTFMEAFLTVYQRDLSKYTYRCGYSERIMEAMLASNNVSEFKQKLLKGSAGYGSLLRAVPCGLVSSYGFNVANLAERLARLTHDRPEAIISSVLVAALANFFWSGGSVGDTVEVERSIRDLYCDSSDRNVFNKSLFFEPLEVGEKVTGFSPFVVRAAITAVKSSPSMTEILKKAVSFGGETNVVAALSMGLASLSPHISNDLSVELHSLIDIGPSGVYPGQFGYAYLDIVDKAFIARFDTK